MNPRHRLDLRTRDLLYAILACPFAGSRRQRASTLAATWSQEGLVCRSLRSAFDLLLAAVALPPGSEVLMSAITHPDMVRIARTHGLSVLPVDVDPETLAPRLDMLEEAVTRRTRMLVVAHLFGTRIDLGPVAQRASRLASGDLPSPREGRRPAQAGGDRLPGRGRRRRS